MTGSIHGWIQGRSQGGHGGHVSPPQSILDENKDLGNYDKYLPLRDSFLAGLLISGLTKEKYNTTLTFALARVMMAFFLQYLVAYLSSYHEKAINALYELVYELPAGADLGGRALCNAPPPLLTLQKRTKLMVPSD